MTDLLTWSINLGRWAGVQVRVHYFLIIIAIGRVANALIFSGNHNVAPTLGWLMLLLVALALHELGHAAMAMIQNADVEDVVLWPLGNLVIPGPSRSTDSVPVAAAGLATSGMLAIGTALLLSLAGAQMIFNPFGHGVDPGSPILFADGKQVEAFKTLWWIGWFGHLNWVLFLANLIPALPLDGGRILRAMLAQSSIGLTRDNPYAQWTARGFAVILALVGVVQALQSVYVGVVLFALAFMIELVVRTESRIMEDGGFFDDGVFGYDFSEGYTSLEANTAKVRPTRESTIKRWRRKRSELRKVRRLAREAAEDRRMDEILEKLHIHGKASLSDEEHRFLVRVSAKLRNRPRARD